MFNAGRLVLLLDDPAFPRHPTRPGLSDGLRGIVNLHGNKGAVISAQSLSPADVRVPARLKSRSDDVNVRRPETYFLLDFNPAPTHPKTTYPADAQENHCTAKFVTLWPQKHSVSA